MVSPSITKAYWTRLVKRRWIGVAGSNSTQFLQSLVTQDLRVFQKASGPSAIPALFLTPTGKVACETLIVQVPKSARWLQSYTYVIDHSFTQTSNLLAMLQKRKLRTDVQFDLLAKDDCSGFQIFPERPTRREAAVPSTSDVQDGTDAWAFWDPRAPLRLGYRVIAGPAYADTLEGSPDGLIQRFPMLKAAEPLSIASKEADAFDQLRLFYGIIEDHDFVKETHKTHTFKPPAADGTDHSVESRYTITQVNYDWFGYLARNKGCYVGQEIVAKLLSTSVVRRRSLIIRTFNGLDLPKAEGLLCVIVNATDEQAKKGSEPVGNAGHQVPVGSVTAAIGTYGIVALNTRTSRRAISDFKSHVPLLKTIPDPPESILEFEQFSRFVKWIETVAETTGGFLAVCTEAERMGVECVGWKLPPDPISSLYSSL